MNLARTIVGRTRRSNKLCVSVRVNPALSLLSVLVLLAAAPAYAQHGGGGHFGGGGHAGGGHMGGGGHSGGPAPAGVGAPGFHGGGTSSNASSGGRATAAPPVFTGMHFAPSPAPAVEGSSQRAAPIYQQHYAYVPAAVASGSPQAGRAARAVLLPARDGPLTATGPSHIVWQAPPRIARPSTIAVFSPSQAPMPAVRRPTGGALPFSSMPFRRGVTPGPAGAKFPSLFGVRGNTLTSRTAISTGILPAPPVQAVGMRPFPFGPPFTPFPQTFFFGSPFFFNSGFFGFGFGSGFFFGGFPFFTPSNCFFNGFSNVCFARPFSPGFFSPFCFNSFFPGLGFSSFGFSPFGFDNFGTFGSSSGLNLSDNVVTAQEPAPASTDYGPYTYQPAQETPASEAAPAETPQTSGVEEPRNAKPLALLFLSDGTSYEVSDYWLEGGRFHYVTSYGGENSIAPDQIDLQRTVDENWKRGIEFALRPAR